MKRPAPDKQKAANLSLTQRLVFLLVVLALLTTLSAGLPAYGLVRTQLERQTRSQVEATRQAAHSLYLAEQQRVENLARLFAQRPTLTRLLATESLPELENYLGEFRSQSQIDILMVCRPDGTVLSSQPRHAQCPTPSQTGFVVLDDLPALLALAPIPDANGVIGFAVAGRWLHGPFLAHMAADAGAELNLRLPDGALLANSQASSQAVAGAERHYYTATIPLTAASGQPALSVEVALPVDELLATERRALTILVGSTSAVALLGILVGVFYIRRLAAPLHGLTEAAERIAEGDFLAAVPRPASPPEVATLAAALERSQGAMLQALAERSQARDWLSTVLESIAEGVVTFDDAGAIMFFSRGAEALTGWSRAEALGQPIEMVFPLAGDEPGRFRDRFRDCVPISGDSLQIEVLTRRGKSTVVAVTAARLTPPGAVVPQTALVLRDVSEEQARRHLRSYFLATVSHEFRTPLSTLNASIELLMNEAETMTGAEMRELLKPTYLGLRSLQTLIDNLLESSSIEAGQFSIHPQPVEINQVLTDALYVVQPMLDRRQQLLVLTEPTHLPVLYADPTRLVQVFVNLISNASKYSPSGQTIELHIEPDEEKVRISISDRGPGIPPDERANLFRRFVRLSAGESQSSSSTQYGIGLGLYVVKKIVEAHAGRVGVDERPGGGSIFWFELPLTTHSND